MDSTFAECVLFSVHHSILTQFIMSMKMQSFDLYLFISGRKWFVSKKGTDSSDCGKTYKTACASFHALWRHIVHKENNSRRNKIKTDTNLIIQNMHLHSPYQRLIFENRAFHVINITIINTSIKNTVLSFGVMFDGVSRIFHLH